MIERNLIKLRREYIILEEKIEALEKKRDNKLKQLQSECNHSVIAETGHTISTFSTNPPGRICKVCGYEEEGWGCGYKKLYKEPLRQINRDKFNQLRYPTHDIITDL